MLDAQSRGNNGHENGKPRSGGAPQDQGILSTNDLAMLLQSDRWLIWSCTVTKLAKPSLPLLWDYPANPGLSLPAWCLIDLEEDENPASALARARPADVALDYSRRCADAISQRATGFSSTYSITLRDGRRGWIDEQVCIRAEAKGTWRLLGICSDATERKLAEEKLIAENKELSDRDRLHQRRLLRLESDRQREDVATTDGLTGVRNYRGFQEQIERRWLEAGAGHKSLSLVLLDIDLFEQFNIANSYAAGDEVLRQVGRLLLDGAREGDCIARYGGEEFAIILPGISAIGAMTIAERHRSAIETAYWEHAPITASFGVASMTSRTENIDALIGAAERALGQAKSSGRNRICHADHKPRQSRRAPNASEYGEAI